MLARPAPAQVAALAYSAWTASAPTADYRIRHIGPVRSLAAADASGAMSDPAPAGLRRLAIAKTMRRSLEPEVCAG
ncbi:hypothetical protein ACWDSJ_18700 [Nocardia sp. NPDC003482]